MLGCTFDKDSAGAGLPVASSALGITKVLGVL
jgi:hypothetical protein